MPQKKTTRKKTTTKKAAPTKKRLQKKDLKKAKGGIGAVWGKNGPLG